MRSIFNEISTKSEQCGGFCERLVGKKMRSSFNETSTKAEQCGGFCERLVGKKMLRIFNESIINFEYKMFPSLHC